MLITEFYQYHLPGHTPVPLERALAFQYLFSHKKLFVDEGELIVGERGPAPKATPTYPEICLHEPQDLDILDSREKVSFRVDGETRKKLIEKVIPFWRGRTHRERLFGKMEPEWVRAYRAGIFTEFQEQRAPGHTVLGKKIYRQGLLDLIAEIDAKMATLQDNRSGNKAPQGEQLQAMKIAAQAMIMYAERNAALLEELAGGEKDSLRSAELQQMAMVCRRVPAHAPETLHEALQYYWFVHLGVISELNPWDSFNPGRLDQHLMPFYEQDIAGGRLTEESARELLQAFWIKFNNHPSPPKIGVTAEESSTYTDFCLINLGGLKEDGTDAVNLMSYLLLDIIEEMRLLQPSSMIQVSSVALSR